MHTRTLVLVCSVIALALPSCDAKTEAKPATKSETKSETKSAEKKSDAGAKADVKAEPAAPAKLELPKLGLKADAPAGTTVSDGIGGEGAMVMGDNLVLNVDPAKDSTPKTIEDAKKEAEMFTPKNIEEEKLADGWVLTFENEGGMGKNYHVQVRREIGGKAWSCTTMQSTPEQQANAVAFCKSLSQ